MSEGEESGEAIIVYVCPVVIYWADLEVRLVNGALPLNVQAAGVGFLAVYDSLDAYRKDYPDIEPLRVGKIKRGA